MSNLIEAIIDNNKKWAEEQKKKNPSYFKDLAHSQAPSIFWIGCCDSRVIPHKMFNLSLGDMFIQTNIANQVPTEDPNTMSALEYAVKVLKVEHIIVCGHTFCGGIMASMSNSTKMLPPNLQRWIEPLKKLYEEKKESLPKESPEKVAEAMSRENVKLQIQTLSRIKWLQDLKKENQNLTLHGWLFHMETGRLEDVARIQL